MNSRKAVPLFLLSGLGGPAAVILTDLLMSLGSPRDLLSGFTPLVIGVAAVLLLTGAVLLFSLFARVRNLSEQGRRGAYRFATTGSGLLLLWSVVHNIVFSVLYHSGALAGGGSLGLVIQVVYAAAIGIFFGVLLIIGIAPDLESVLPLELALSGEARTLGLTARFYLAITITVVAFVFGAFAVALYPVYLGLPVATALVRASIVAVPFVLCTVLEVQFLAGMTTKEISRAVPVLNELTQGDLTRRLSARGVDEVSLALHQIDRFAGSVASSITDATASAGESEHLSGELDSQAERQQTAVTSVSESVTAVARQIQDLGSRIDTTVSATEEISRTLESLERLVATQAAGVEETASAATDLRDRSANVVAVSEAREVAAGELTLTIRSSREELERAMGTVETMGGRAGELNELNGVIARLAAQTNLLAMNAAIEAAHAGDAGRGFAVVASEIRGLAESASRSSKESSAFIKEMVEGVHATTEMMNRVQYSFSQLHTETNEVASSMSSIVGAARQMRENAGGILSQMEQLRDGIQEIVGGAAQISEGLLEINGASQASNEVAARTRDEIAGVEQQTGELTEIAQSIARVSSTLRSSADSLAQRLREYTLS